MSEKNYNSIAVAIVISVLLVLAAAVVISVMINSTPSYNSSYNPSYNNNYAPPPTSTPIPKAEFRVYNKELSWGSRQELVAKHLLAKDDYRTVYYLYGSCYVTNYGDAGGFATVKLTQQGDGGTTITREQTLYFNVGETHVLYWNIDDIKYDTGVYWMEVI